MSCHTCGKEHCVQSSEKNYFGKYCCFIGSFMFGTVHQSKKGVWAMRSMVMVGKCEGKRRTCRSDDNLKKYFQRNRMRGSALD